MYFICPWMVFCAYHGILFMGIAANQGDSRMKAVDSGRQMTQLERDEFYWLAQAYNRIMPWHEFKHPFPHKSPPMHEFSFRDTYLDLVERRRICANAGIKLEPIYHDL